jgi:hypothetical protein
MAPPLRYQLEDLEFSGQGYTTVKKATPRKVNGEIYDCVITIPPRFAGQTFKVYLIPEEENEKSETTGTEEVLSQTD